MAREGLMDDTGYDFGASDDYYQALDEAREAELLEFEKYKREHNMCEYESSNGNCLINECMFEPSSLCDKVRLNIYKELENDLKNSVNLELYELGRKDAIEEFAGVILCEIDNMGVQRTVLRVMEQLKEKQNESS